MDKSTDYRDPRSARRIKADAIKADAELREMMRPMDDENTTIELTRDLANAICDYEDIGFSEGLAAETNEQQEAWLRLVDAAEKRVCRVTHAKRQPAIS